MTKKHSVVEIHWDMEESDDEDWIAWYKYCPHCWQEYEDHTQRFSIERQPVLLVARIKEYTGKDVSPETVKEWIDTDDAEFVMRKVGELK